MAPEWEVERWVNGTATLASLRDRVVMLVAFQLHCTGCVRYALPQAQEFALAFPELAVIGLHTVFEAEAENSDAALRAFLAEHDLRFPIGRDRDGATLARYGMQGTPTLVLIDRQGRRRMQRLGPVPDADLRRAILELIHE